MSRTEQLEEYAARLAALEADSAAGRRREENKRRAEQALPIQEPDPRFMSDFNREQHKLHEATRQARLVEAEAKAAELAAQRARNAPRIADLDQRLAELAEAVAAVDAEHVRKLEGLTRKQRQLRSLRDRLDAGELVGRR
jgi:hypothetical protein